VTAGHQADQYLAEDTSLSNDDVTDFTFEACRELASALEGDRRSLL
jgi:hypothetical protein